MFTNAMAITVKAEPALEPDYLVPDWADQLELDTAQILHDDTFIGVTEPVRPNSSVEFVDATGTRTATATSSSPSCYQQQHYTNPSYSTSGNNTSFYQLIEPQPVSPVQSYPLHQQLLHFRDRTFSSGHTALSTDAGHQLDTGLSWIDEADLSEVFDESALESLNAEVLAVDSAPRHPPKASAVPSKPMTTTAGRQLQPRESVMRVDEDLHMLLDTSVNDKRLILQEILRECESFEQSSSSSAARLTSATSPSASYSSSGEPSSAESSRSASPAPPTGGRKSGGVKRRTREEAKERKREQNRMAALKYRAKKKQERKAHGCTVQVLEDKNMKLRGQLEDALSEVRYLKKLMTEVGVPIAKMRARMVK